MYFNFTIRLLELENVSSKQLISENDHFQQVAREYYEGVATLIMILYVTINIHTDIYIFSRIWIDRYAGFL